MLGLGSTPRTCRHAAPDSIMHGGRCASAGASLRTGSPLASPSPFGLDRRAFRGKVGRAVKKRGKRAAAPARAEQNVGVKSGALRLEDLIGYNLRRAHGIQRQRFAAVFAPLSIRPVQLSILGLVYENPRLKQSDLGKALDIKRANVVTLLDQLERRNLIERKPARTDRRSLVLQLTPAGRKLTTQLLELHRRLEADLTKHLGLRERDQLLKLLKQFRQLQTSPGLDYED
jgi:DNA-binding MarR family transcriptional regulator